ncbi:MULTISPECIES: hypothetical protein [unclassified Enterococcus]|uniref:hypothetical protein n=1 Tax=unclassified Enterococcus TaxID=2608891 RepID=UPI001F14F863|nr:MULTISPECIES: hypothetical protein [unclassified Enterococcus]
MEGYLGFEFVTQNHRWRYANTQLPANRESQPRQDKMQLVTRNTTLADSDSYKVKLSASELTHETSGHVIDEEWLVFKEGAAESGLGSIALNVDEIYEFDENQGLLLKLNNKNDVGVYKGIVTWSIEDAL